MIAILDLEELLQVKISQSQAVYSFPPGAIAGLLECWSNLVNERDYIVSLFSLFTHYHSGM